MSNDINYKHQTVEVCYSIHYRIAGTNDRLIRWSIDFDNRVDADNEVLRILDHVGQDIEVRICKESVVRSVEVLYALTVTVY